MRIGLVAICKNNEDIILRMLSSAVPHVDEVHITDTGSTDKTVELIHTYMASTGKPYTVETFIETPFHFANARNKSIEALDSKCDFLLSLDTDDVLPADWKWPDFTADVYTQRYPYQVMRLWRTKKGIRYVNRIHEVIHWDPSCKVERTNATITHLQSDNRDPERNIRLLRLEDATHRTIFYIGNEYADLGKREQAIVYYQHYINRCMFEPHWQEELMCAVWRCARHLERLGRVDESTRVALHGVSINPNYAELWRQLAWNHRHIPAKAMEYTLKANDCQFFPHLFAEAHMYQPTHWNILRPGANGDLVMLSAVTTQLKRCILYTKCKEVGATLDGVVEVRDSDEWESRNKNYPDFLPMYPRDNLKEPIIETFCKQIGLPVGPMKLKG